MTAPSDAARPVLRTGGGLYWLDVDGVDDCFEFGSAITIATNMTLIYGTNRSATTIDVLNLGNSASYTISDAQWYSGDNKIYIGLGGVDIAHPANANTGKFVITSTRDDTAEIVRLNGAQYASRGSPAVSGTLDTLWRGNTDYFSEADYYGGIFDLTTLSGADLAAAEAYMTEKLGASLYDPSVNSIWLDASDLSTMFQERTGASATTPSVVDGVVGSWQNKGTLGGWAVALADSSRPILRSAGGLYWLEGDGVDDSLDMDDAWLSLFQNVDKAMIAVAARAGAAAGPSPVAWHKNAANFARVMVYHDGGWMVAGRRLDADSFAGTTGQGADTADRVIRGHLDYANADAFLYRDGVLLNSNTSFQTAGSTSNTASDTSSCVVSGATNSGFMDGRIYAIIAGTLLPNHADIASIDAYLAGKAGVTL